MSDLVQLINQEFERTVPTIHKEGKDNYVLIQRTDSGITDHGKSYFRISSKKTCK